MAHQYILRSPLTNPIPIHPSSVSKFFFYLYVFDHWPLGSKSFASLDGMLQYTP